MKKTIRLLLVITSMSLLVAATNIPNIQITGVKKEIAANVQARLTEFAQEKPLSSQPDEELRIQVAKALEPYGYFMPQIRIPSRQPLQVIIVPGPQVFITSVTIDIQGEGANDPVIRKTIAEFPIKQGDPLNSVQYEEAKQTILNTAEHQGYLRASFEKSEVLVDPQYNTAHITLIFHTGMQFYFGQVQFDPTYISPDLLRRYVPFRYGQPYSTDQILALNNQLAASGYFQSVSVKPQLNNHRYIPVDVHLQPVSRINYSFGIGYGTDTGPRGRLGYHVVPVNRAGHKFNAFALGSVNENSLQAQYVIPGTNPITDQYSLTTNLSNLNYDSGSSNALLASLAQQHIKPRYQRTLSLNGLYERFSYTFEPKEEKTTFFPKAIFTWRNTQDNLFSPSGYNITINGLGASRAVLSDISFVQASINLKAALTVDPIRTRFYFHSIQGITQINDINQMPLSLAFLLGGSENLKGYSYNTIGPGKILTFNGIEIQKETVTNWYLIGFLDSGDVYRPTPKNLKNDVGIGLMWVSPVGPIKIGVAQAVDRHFNRSEKRPRLVINMGPDL
ncbi:MULTISPECIES: autotransporter assembly complex family protein [unclassified Legionella]|uniref:autotransporter assembly complex protein TamA n=1 Tax=unclassified Legionella TaxID=2622702 RepID=UPI001056C67D|nr:MULTISPECIES: BamA/TamA family outer membrane protein [unclassified Legionella]MDI9819151.1 BamA/TamA family outer membrane protein [Legionella sp. PL877]